MAELSPKARAAWQKYQRDEQELKCNSIKLDAAWKFERLEKVSGILGFFRDPLGLRREEFRSEYEQSLRDVNSCQVQSGTKPDVAKRQSKEQGKHGEAKLK